MLKDFIKDLNDIEADLKERYPDDEEGISLATAYALEAAKKYLN